MPRRNDDVPARIDGIKELRTCPGDVGEISGTRKLIDESGTNTGRTTLRGRTESTDGAPVKGSTALKLNDLPILRPPVGFRAPIFRCRAPTLAWQHCGCPSHSHLPPRRSSTIWSALKHYGQEPFYRTWPNRNARRFARPSRRTVGTQSSFDGSRTSLGALRCVVRSIDMTESSMDLEIGATIPF